MHLPRLIGVLRISPDKKKKKIDLMEYNLHLSILFKNGSIGCYQLKGLPQLG